jgi:hypothetical protein
MTFCEYTYEMAFPGMMQGLERGPALAPPRPKTLPYSVFTPRAALV